MCLQAAVPSGSGRRGRALSDVESEEEPVIVGTPQALHDAIAKGRLNIEVVAHLDLTTLPLKLNTGCPDGCDSPLPELTLTKTIRGNCAAPPTDEELRPLTGTPGAVGLLPFQEGQCLIVNNEDNFRTLSHRLWLDNLYLRVGHYRLDNLREYAFINLASFEPLHWPLTGRGRRYVTRTTLQGDGVGPGVGVWAREDTYIENCTFANLGGDGFGDACPDCTGAVNADKGAAVTIVNSTFFDPVRLPGTSYVRAWDSARVAISGCSFADPPGVEDELFYARDNATVYADDTTIRVRSDAGAPVAARPLSAAPKLPSNSSDAFPGRDDPWLVFHINAFNLTLVPRPSYAAPTAPVPILDIDIAPAPAPASDLAASAAAAEAASAASGSGGDGGPSDSTIAAIVLGSLLLCFVLLALFLCVRLWQKRGKGEKHMAEGKQPGGLGGEQAEQVGGKAVPPPGGPLPWDNPKMRAAAGAAGPAGSFTRPHPSLPTVGLRSATSQDPGGGPGAAAAALTVEGGGTPAPAALMAPMPPAGAPVAQRLAYCNLQLSSIRPDACILRQFKLLGASERREGDQSVVAFATGELDGKAYALKFFVARAAFQRAMLRPAGPISLLLPKIHAVHDPDAPAEEGVPGMHACTDSLGQPLPPCIVYGRGESLVQWLQRAKTDVFQAVTVLSHVATRLRDIHAAGYVHCDVKPAHILLLPHENRWTVIDFDKAAVAGTSVAMDYTLDYAAPEVVAATGPVAAEPSVDAWALGVIAFELLTGGKALDSAGAGAATVEAQLRGDTALPWEDSRLSGAARRQLGVFQEAVLGLLRRDPAQRATVKDLCAACEAVVTSQTTTAPA